MNTPYIPTEAEKARVLIIGVQTPENRTIDAAAYFGEFRQLVESSGITLYKEHYVKLRSLDNAYFFTKGKLEEIVALCADGQFDDVIISEPLLAHQERNLNKLLHVRIFDRTALILDIFEQGAHSAEGKLQVAVAKLQYKKTRLSGRGLHMSQQSGQVGSRGPGETQKERELQHIENQMLKLRRDLEHLEKVRATQSKQRLSQREPHISIIGYTNAGKSTILNLLTKSSVYAENRLFATLDTTTRELFLKGRKKGTISDTVGFIQSLPHQLIEAFKSTLAELTYADLLMLVVDASDKNWQHHIRVVKSILQELKVANKEILFVFNKVDLLPEAERARLEKESESYKPHVFVSALSKETVQPLVDFLEYWKRL